MRVLFPDERVYIEQLLKAKKESNFKGLETVKLLKNTLDILIIEWNAQNYTIKIHQQMLAPPTINTATYFKIVDFLVLIKELETNGYIFISRFKPDNLLENILYNRDLYKGIEREGHFMRLIKKDNTKTEKLLYDTLNTDVALLFDKYALSIIFPLKSLEDLVEHNYQDIEQQRFEKQLKEERKKHRQQMRWARWSFIVAMFAAIISAIVPFFTPDTNVEPTHIQKQEQAIIKSKSELPEHIKVISQDTIVVKSIK